MVMKKQIEDKKCCIINYKSEQWCDIFIPIIISVMVLHVSAQRWNYPSTFDC